MSAKPDARWHNGAESRLMVEKDGWCMVRRPGCIPYTIYAKDWHKLPDVETGRKHAAEYAAAMRDPANWNLRP